MNLKALYRRLEHEHGTELDGEPIKIMTPDGEVFEILSVNWDEADDQWLIISE